MLKKNNILLLAYDQGMEHGPEDFNQENINPEFVLDIAQKAKFDAIIFQKGIAEKYWDNQVPLIIKLNGKTKLRKGEPISTQVCSVKEAKDLGAIGIGYTIYLGSEHESKMLEEFGRIEQEAEKLDLSVIGWMYPRGKGVKNPTDPKIIAYAARAGLELGADYVKINYPGAVKDLAWAVKSAGKTKVLVSGGNKLSNQEFIKLAKNIKSAGCAGMAVGRNIWQSKNALKIAKLLREIFL